MGGGYLLSRKSEERNGSRNLVGWNFGIKVNTGYIGTLRINMSMTILIALAALGGLTLLLAMLILPIKALRLRRSAHRRGGRYVAPRQLRRL